jgi:hypothetical protein
MYDDWYDETKIYLFRYLRSNPNGLDLLVLSISLNGTRYPRLLITIYPNFINGDYCSDLIWNYGSWHHEDKVEI